MCDLDLACYDDVACPRFPVSCNSLAFASGASRLFRRVTWGARCCPCCVRTPVRRRGSHGSRGLNLVLGALPRLGCPWARGLVCVALRVCARAGRGVAQHTGSFPARVSRSSVRRSTVRCRLRINSIPRTRGYSVVMCRAGSPKSIFL